MWVDVRVCAGDELRAIEAVHRVFPKAWFMFRPDPPSTGPEVELTFEGVPEETVAALLTLGTGLGPPVEILAIRTRHDASEFEELGPVVRDG